MYEIFEQLLQVNEVSAYKFCKETGISQSTISTWKKQKNLISGELAKTIAEYFGVSIDYLMGSAKRIFCHDCGVFYNPLDDDEAKNHQFIHSKWEKAVEKFGFCMNYIRADEKQLLHKKILNEPNNSAGSEVYHFEELMKANFSDLIRANDFDYFYDFDTFVSKQLSKHSIRALISEKAYEMLVEKYGVDYNVDSHSKEDNNGTNDDTPLNIALNKLNIGENELTEEEIKDIVQFASFILSKKKLSDNSILNAAHAINGATEEDKQYDEDIMDDDNF